MLDLLHRIYERMYTHIENKHCSFFLVRNWPAEDLQEIFDKCNINYKWLHNSETLMLDYNDLSIKEFKTQIELFTLEGDFDD